MEASLGATLHLLCFPPHALEITMHRPKPFTFLLFAVTIAMSVLVIATVPRWFDCWTFGDYRRPLPNGYRLIRSNPDTVAVVPPPGGVAHHDSHAGHGVAVAALIDKIGSSGHIVYGHVIPSKSFMLSGIERVGWFIVDTESNIAELGLSDEEWKLSLARLGIQLDEIRLSRPSCYR